MSHFLFPILVNSMYVRFGGSLNTTFVIFIMQEKTESLTKLTCSFMANQNQNAIIAFFMFCLKTYF